VRNEQVAARAEPERHLGIEPLVRLGIKRRRLTRQPTGDRRPPLLAHAARLDARRSRPDAGALEDGNTHTTAGQLSSDRESDDAGSDHRDVKSRISHVAQL
jgi:hypothetical protein